MAKNDMSQNDVLIIIVAVIIAIIAWAIVLIAPLANSIEKLEQQNDKLFDFNDNECIDFEQNCWFDPPESGSQICRGGICHMYCHTYQKQVGKKCEEIRKVNKTKLDESCVKGEKGLLFCIHYNVSIWEPTTQEGKILLPLKGEMFYNETVCEPVYKEIQYGCQSGEDVRSWKE